MFFSNQAHPQSIKYYLGINLEAKTTDLLLEAETNSRMSRTLLPASLIKMEKGLPNMSDLYSNFSLHVPLREIGPS